MTANYCGMISQIDHHVGRIIDALDTLRFSDNTLVLYTTDHGELLGHHGLYLKHPMPYEDLLRVGLVVQGPGVAPGRVVDEVVSTLDLAQRSMRMRASRSRKRCRAAACVPSWKARATHGTWPIANGTSIRRGAACR